MRLIWITVGLFAIILIPFLIWGERFDEWFTGDAAIAWLRGWGTMGWLAVILLIMSDLVLPVPGTAVMSAAGFLYGALLGGLLSAAGSFLAGLLAYGLCRRFGYGLALKLAGPKDLARGEALFRNRGVWFVALSRSMPLLAESMPCLAGITRMPFRIFVVALACGSLPTAFIFAGIGAIGQQNVKLALALSIAVPAVLWLAAKLWLKRSG